MKKTIERSIYMKQKGLLKGKTSGKIPKNNLNTNNTIHRNLKAF